jgi:predicted Zn finger-like uncharacterized protein
MIVRCKKCETKFTFDDSVVEGVGAWVRCSRCKNIFFLDKPLTDAGISQTSIETGMVDVPVQSREEKRIVLNDDLMQVFTPPETERFENVMAAEMQRGKQIAAIEKASGETDRHYSASEKAKDMKIDHEEEDEEAEVEEQPARFLGKQWLYLLIVLLLGGIYLCFFSEIGSRARNVASSSISSVIDNIRGVNPRGDEVGPAQVDLTDIRQRVVVNASLGIIRVVEGTAVNQAMHPMTRIRVRGEIVGDGGVLLGERESYCGNLLTADELAAMTEDQLQKELSNPQGSDVSNDRIAPKGQIPFMIVFTREPTGVVKTFVVPSGAERLLP